MTHRPITTLFLLQSVDGKITTGASDALDFDRDFPRIPGLREGLHQYYEIEQTTDLWSLNSGRVQAKMGVNEKPMPEKTPVSFVILDNHHLTRRGVEYFCARSREFVLATSNPRHPAYEVAADNLHIFQQSHLSLRDLLRYLKEKFGCERITVQTGGTLNGLLLPIICAIIWRITADKKFMGEDANKMWLNVIFAVVQVVTILLAVRVFINLIG